MTVANATTPLIALTAVAVDTETTGLDTATARILQIGAIYVARSGVEEGRTLDLLVDPGQPIPAASTRIHGITDDRVKDAPAFPKALARLQEFAGDNLLIGHSIGYDLAVLDRECRRAGIPWIQPRSLCVRLLARLANPLLPDHSLETIASWLGMEVAGRHSALGDATMAARAFLLLLPELRKLGIRTLGEAESACLGLSSDLDRGYRAGWAEPVSRPADAVVGVADPYAYRHRVGELMSQPVVVMSSHETLGAVIARMVERQISSIFISDAAEAHRPIAEYGIVTERDMMRRIATGGKDALSLPVGELATRPVVSIAASAFVYRAIARMDRLKIRHLAVEDEANRLVGIVSARDMLRLRAESAIEIDDDIASASDAAAMAAAWATLPAVARSLLSEGIDARRVTEVISEELCAMTQRASELAEQWMEAEGHGPPPCRYAVLVLGSGGRGESLLAADQDNAIVFEAGEQGGLEDRWFAGLGARIADMLDVAGVPLCKGGVMASNAEFRGSTELWMKRVETWLARSRPEDLLNVDIFFDMRAVHGDCELGTWLFDHAYERGASAPAFAKLLGGQIQPANPFNVFGGFRLDGGRLDLKLHVLFPIVAAARTLAIRRDLRLRGTAARLAALIASKTGGESDLRAMLDGHSLALAATLSQQHRDFNAGIPVSNRVEMGKLAREDQVRLKDVMQRLQHAPDLIRDLMFS